MFSFFGPKKYKNVDVTAFKDLKKERNTVIIDVRAKHELTQGSIPGHRLMNMMDPTFNNKLGKLDKGKTYLLYCRSGFRSKRVCRRMGKMGFDNLYNLKGGIMAWNSHH